jgi:hypothetical protein
MARIKTVSEGEARGIRKMALRLVKRRYGYVPGIVKVGLVDLAVGRRMGGDLRPSASPQVLAADPPSARDAGRRGQRPRQRGSLTRSPYGGRAPPDRR